jgi:DNA repair protein RadC
MQVATARQAADLLAPLLQSAGGEAVAVAYLGDRQQLLGTGRSEGGADAADLPIRQIVAEALRLGASGLIIAHNHPSGDASPSEADLSATRRLAETAAAVGLRLHDHLIFAGPGCRSLRELGLL